MRFVTVKMAEVVIRVGVNFFYTENLFRDFICEEKDYKFIVQCSMNDYVCAGEKYEKTYHHDPPSDVYLEEYALFEKIYERFTDYGILTLHGAAIAVNNQALLFSAPSGTGKTTHIGKWIENIPGSFIVNGDKPFIMTGKKPIVCGSPWAGKEHQYTNTMVPLKSIIFMERSEENRIDKMTFAESIPLLLQQTFRPDSSERMRKTLRMLESVGRSISFYHFRCNNLKDDCFEVAFNALVRNSE